MKKEEPAFYVSQWQIIQAQFKKNKIGLVALIFFLVFFFVALYAPFFASSKPLFVVWGHKLYFPLFRYLLYPGFYTKPIDLFFNLLMFTLPLGILGFLFLKKGRRLFLITLTAVHFIVYGLILSGLVKNPESNSRLKLAYGSALEQKKAREDPLLAPLPVQKTWAFQLQYLSSYEKLNMLLRFMQRKKQHERLQKYFEKSMPTLWAVDQKNENQKRQALEKVLSDSESAYSDALNKLPFLMSAYLPLSHAFIMAKYEFEHASKEELPLAEERFKKIVAEALPTRLPLIEAKRTLETYENAQGELNMLLQKNIWLEEESKKIHVLIPAIVRDFHWQDDAGGSQAINRRVPWWELSRINRKDLVAGLIFGVRVSLIVGITAVAISLLFGVMTGMASGYFAGKTDLLICRLIEIWEAMPIFFMLLLIVSITQSKSLFVVIMVLGIFGWTSKARFMRGEVLKQRNLPYVLACKSLGFKNGRIMFFHILPNAIAPILTLLPFSMMAAITSEAGLSFLGLGEEGSTSWGVLMDEGRAVFPAESYLLWPPAILLSLLLISIALIGDALRDAIDPRMRA